MREAVTVPHNGLKTAYFRFAGVGKYLHLCPTLEVGNIESDGRDAADLLRPNWDDGPSLNGSACVQRTEAVDVEKAGVEGHVESARAVRVNRYVHHERLIPKVRRPVDVEDDGEVVGIVGGVELGDIEQALSSKTVSKVLREESRSPVDSQLLRLSMRVSAVNVLNIPSLCDGGERNEREEKEENGA